MREPLAAVAAEGREFAGLLRHASRVERLEWPIEFARRAEIAGSVWLMAAHGPGPRLAERAAGVAVERGRPRALASIGLCGALAPELAPASIFVAGEVLAADGGTWPASLPAEAPPAAKGRAISIDRVAVSAREKSELRRSGAAVVEMEAAAVARTASGRGVPFYCIRAVSDTASEDLPLDFNIYRDAEGRFSRARIAAAVLLRPRRIPSLLRFDRNCREAARRLGDYLVHCRF
jgi:adenosylhomocysteine nucleosidase